MAWLAQKKKAAAAISKRNSKYEETFEADLTARAVQYQYEAVKVAFTPPIKVCHKTWDWLITTKSGKVIIVETKGWWERKTRLRETAAIEQNPDLDIRYVFQRASTPIGKGSKTTYGKWCDKHDIKWADGLLPQEWLDE